ncbi:MAG: glycosyltransferase family 2 protein [bacterium]|nr:glycosyltransferase family 2 protein [bacterium]
MTLSIIIVNYKNRELLKLCLQSLEQHVLPNIESEVLVVDSEAEAETAEMIREDFPKMQYLLEQNNVGYAKGVNRGLRKAQGSYILILNPDIIVTSGTVETMLEFIKTNPEVGLVGPRLLNFDGSVQNSRFRFYRPSTILYRRSFLGKLPFGQKGLDRFHMKDVTSEEIAWPDWLMGSALLTTREAINKVGLLDERFFLYFEDVDWAKRFWENGYKVAYLPKATMYHYLQRRSKAGLGPLDFFLRREARWHLQSAFKYFSKHGLNYHSGPEIFKHVR